MLSIEEIKLLIEKLEKLKDQDFKKLVDENLRILKDLATSVDAYNNKIIGRYDKTPEWFDKDLEVKRDRPVVDHWLYTIIERKIFQFAKTNIYNSLEIGPGNGMFSKEFRAWKSNYFLDILPSVERRVRRRFPPAHQKYLTFYLTRDTDCANIPQGSCNFVFSWDTFVFFTQQRVQQYLHDIKRILIPGGYVFVQYADCHYDFDLRAAQRGYWNYNTKSHMEKIIRDEGYQVIEMNQFRPGANYAIFRKPGKINPVHYKISDLTLD